QLPRPARGAFGADPGPGGDHRDHPADHRHPGHEVQREPDAVEGVVPVRQPDRPEDHQRIGQREEQEPPVAEELEYLVADVGQAGHRTCSLLVASSLVSARNASSSRAPETSTSRAAGNSLSSARSAASGSAADRITVPPCWSAPVTPGSAARRARSAPSVPGSVARIVRPPTRALISVAGPSAT